MRKIMEFNGRKSISLVEKKDYNILRETLPDNEDYREIMIFNQSDFKRAENAGCQIYLKSFEYNGCKVERFFVRVPKDKLFEIALK